MGENGIEKEWNVIFIARLLTYNTHARVGQSKASRMEFQTIFFFFLVGSGAPAYFLGVNLLLFSPFFFFFFPVYDFFHSGYTGREGWSACYYSKRAGAASS